MVVSHNTSPYPIAAQHPCSSPIPEQFDGPDHRQALLAVELAHALQAPLAEYQRHTREPVEPRCSPPPDSAGLYQCARFEIPIGVQTPEDVFLALVLLGCAYVLSVLRMSWQSDRKGVDSEALVPPAHPCYGA